MTPELERPPVVWVIRWPEVEAGYLFRGHDLWRVVGADGRDLDSQYGGDRPDRYYDTREAAEAVLLERLIRHRGTIEAEYAKRMADERDRTTEAIDRLQARRASAGA